MKASVNMVSKAPVVPVLTPRLMHMEVTTKVPILTLILQIPTPHLQVFMISMLPLCLLPVQAMVPSALNITLATVLVMAPAMVPAMALVTVLATVLTTAQATAQAMSPVTAPATALDMIQATVPAMAQATAPATAQAMALATVPATVKALLKEDLPTSVANMVAAHLTKVATVRTLK